MRVTHLLNIEVIHEVPVKLIYKIRPKSDVSIELHMIIWILKQNLFSSLKTAERVFPSNWILLKVGVASFGSGAGCESEIFPHVYARVTFYMDWISETTGIPIEP